MEQHAQQRQHHQLLQSRREFKPLRFYFSASVEWFRQEQWTRNIRIANNNRKIADWAFTQQAITTITNTITAYWELAYARENVKVNQQAVTVSQKLFEDNKKQLEIGSLARLST